MRPDTEILPHQLRIPREGDVTRIRLPQTGSHVGDRIVEVVLEQERDVVLDRVGGEPVPETEPVELEHLLQDAGERDELIQTAVGDHERQPAGVAEQPEGVALPRAVRCRVEVRGCLDPAHQPHPTGRRSGEHHGLGEHLRITQPQLVGAVAAHRIAGYHSAIRVGAELLHGAGEHLPHVEFTLVEVPARRPARQWRDDDRVTAVADLVQQFGIEGGVLVLAQRQRVQQQRQRQFPARCVRGRQTHRIRLHPAEELRCGVEDVPRADALTQLQRRDVPPCRGAGDHLLVVGAPVGEVVPRHGQGEL
ncbi:hypothetical protein AU194_17050 [Mycobacterium sp. GA-2829]|nr:hypothetical protein AU194_17050 [Mycobacterium sp. GA-2829]